MIDLFLRGEELSANLDDAGARLSGESLRGLFRCRIASASIGATVPAHEY
jgi:hypothetical protein